MWVPKWVVQSWQAHSDQGSLRSLIAENNVLRGRNLELEKRAVAAEITNDWLRARLNQVEAERSILLSKQVGVPFGAPVIHTAAPPFEGEGIPSIGDELSFDDIGDEKARQLGMEP
jgi:hypothetical protein